MYYYRACACVLLCLTLTLHMGNFVSPCCKNITIAVILERSAELDMPFTINRTIGIIELAKRKAQEMTADLAHLDFIVRYIDAPRCTSRSWGALAAELYHINDVHAIIGPGTLYMCSQICIIGLLFGKHAYSSILKISPPKTESFQIKILLKN